MAGKHVLQGSVFIDCYITVSLSYGTGVGAENMAVLGIEMLHTLSHISITLGRGC